MTDRQGDGMTTLMSEHFDAPGCSRDMHALAAAGERAGDVLAGRTVWCAMALPGASRWAEQLRTRVDGAGPGVAAAPLKVTVGDQLRRLAERVDALLAGVSRSQGPRPASEPGFGPAEQELYAEGARDSDDLVGDAVGTGDVFVAHDALSAIVAGPIRERGAHAIWSVRAEGSSPAAMSRALDFLSRFTDGVDAYVLTWHERDVRGDVIERVAAVMPSAGLVSAKEFPTRLPGEEPRRLAWRMALAEIVRSDRGECVGGTLHPRPSVAAR
jgi:hypothetical protein